MSESSKAAFVGLDVSKAHHAVAVADMARRQAVPARHIGDPYPWLETLRHDRRLRLNYPAPTTGRALKHLQPGHAPSVCFK